MDKYILFFYLSSCNSSYSWKSSKKACVARNWINSVPQTATTNFAFAFSSVFILLHMQQAFFLSIYSFSGKMLKNVEHSHLGWVSRSFRNPKKQTSLRMQKKKYILLNMRVETKRKMILFHRVSLGRWLCRPGVDVVVDYADADGKLFNFKKYK